MVKVAYKDPEIQVVGVFPLIKIEILMEEYLKYKQKISVFINIF